MLLARAFWRVWKRPDGGTAVEMTCPRCHRTARLSAHTVDADGKVSPSVVCPTPNCGFHEWVQLECWVP